MCMPTRDEIHAAHRQGGVHDSCRGRCFATGLIRVMVIAENRCGVSA